MFLALKPNMLKFEFKNKSIFENLDQNCVYKPEVIYFTTVLVFTWPILVGKLSIWKNIYLDLH